MTNDKTEKKVNAFIGELPALDSFLEIIAKIEPIPFLGFTVSPAFWNKIRDDNLVKIVTGGIAWNVTVVVVNGQYQDWLQWNDRKQMEYFIERTNLPC